jgi:hypothetical protein
VIKRDVAGDCFISETEVDIKHEGAMLAYEVRLQHQASLAPFAPEWIAQ